jgi:hypothetical protein
MAKKPASIRLELGFSVAYSPDLTQKEIVVIAGLFRAGKQN